MRTSTQRWVAGIGAGLLAMTGGILAASAPASAAVEGVADLAVTLTDSPDPITLGEGPITYTVMLTNNGPDPVPESRVILSVAPLDSTGSPVTFAPVAPNCGITTSGPGRTVSCDLGALGVNQQVTVTFEATPSAAGELGAYAAISRAIEARSAAPTDPDPSNDSAQETTLVQESTPEADLSIDLYRDPAGSVTAGASVDYIAFVDNFVGPDDAEAGSRFLLDGPYESVEVLNGDCAVEGTSEVVCAPALREVNAPAQPAVIRVVTSDPGLLTVTSEVVFEDVDDPELANNSDTIETTIDPVPADLSVTVSGAPGEIEVGQGPVEFTVNVLNDGPGAASEVTGTIELTGAGVSIDEVATSQGSCEAEANEAICNLGDVAVAGEASITVMAVPAEAGTLTASASVSSAGQSDPDEGNNTAVVEREVVDPVADIGVSLEASPSSLLGSYITYDLVVNNHGPDAASSATIRVDLPTTVYSATNLSAGCSYSGADDQVTCLIGEMDDGQSATRSFRANLGLLSLGPLPATAVRAGSSPHDPNASNDASSADCQVLTSLLITCS